MLGKIKALPIRIYSLDEVAKQGRVFQVHFMSQVQKLKLKFTFD